MQLGVLTSNNGTFLTSTVSISNVHIFRVWNTRGWGSAASGYIQGGPGGTARVGLAGSRGGLWGVVTRKSLFSGSSSLSRKEVGPISRRRQMLLLSAWSCCQLRRSLKCLRLSEALQPLRCILSGQGRRQPLRFLSRPPVSMTTACPPVALETAVESQCPRVPCAEVCFRSSPPPPLLPEATILTVECF